jgi:outer membrane protein OmpA-like peptidoglycan-associated protein
MTRKLSVLCAAIALVATSPAHAQSQGQYEIGVGAGVPLYKKQLGLDNKVGFGARLGRMFTDKIGFEVDAFYYQSEPESGSFTGVLVKEIPMHGRFTYNISGNNGLGVVFGLGFAYNYWYDDAGTYFQRDGSGFDKSADYGPSGLFGLRFGGSGPLTVRLDFTGDYIPNPIDETLNGIDNRTDLALNAVMGFAFGGHKAPKDSDMDGVVNKADLCPDTPAGDAVDANGCSLPKDSDGDGVTDDKDKCPNTPAGAKVDANGCPFGDADKDGVTDNLDKCPNTPAGATVDANGCPSDQDGDGVFNGLDKCPDTPAGTKVNATGCPTDSDGDGVTDNLDKCPNTPAGMKVDATGCPVLFEAGKTALVLEGVTFAVNSATLDPSSTAILDRVANALQNNPGGARIEVAGYTDNTGARAHNMTLSQARAQSVLTYLVGKGVPAAMLTAKGYGPDAPIDTNATAAGRANNRRVVLNKVK